MHQLGEESAQEEPRGLSDVWRYGGGGSRKRGWDGVATEEENQAKCGTPKPRDDSVKEKAVVSCVKFHC